MIFILKAFSVALFASMLFVAYMTWRHDWGRKHFMVARKMKSYPPAYLWTLLGERWYVRLYVIGVVIGVFAAATLFLIIQIYL